jgi:hypothetical protein
MGFVRGGGRAGSPARTHNPELDLTFIPLPCDPMKAVDRAAQHQVGPPR